MTHPHPTFCLSGFRVHVRPVLCRGVNLYHPPTHRYEKITKHGKTRRTTNRRHKRKGYASCLRFAALPTACEENPKNNQKVTRMSSGPYLFPSPYYIVTMYCTDIIRSMLVFIIALYYTSTSYFSFQQHIFAFITCFEFYCWLQQLELCVYVPHYEHNYSCIRA